MEYQKIDVRLEDFVSRIPAMFPYLEWNDDGTTTTHMASDSPNGCYGKVVDNMKMPKDVRLTNYVQIETDEVRENYEWTDSNTIGVSENEKIYFTNSGASFLRKVLWYYYVKSDSDLPDAEPFDDVPVVVTDESPLEIKTPKKGEDGSFIECENVTLYDYYTKEGVYYYYARKDIISPCHTYSYRTIINEYYKYKDIVGTDNRFIRFVDEGIGLIKTDRRLLNLEDRDKYPEVPEQIYLSQVKSLKNEYDEYRKAYLHYINYYETKGLTSVSLEAKAKKYVRMGGDNMTNWLGQMIQKAYDVAAVYKCYADNKGFETSFTTNVMLSKHSANIGLRRVLENVFVPGNRYYDGDIVYYEGKTHVCKLDRLISGSPNNYKYIRMTREIGGRYLNSLYTLDGTQESYTRIAPSNLTYLQASAGIPETRVTDYIVIDGQYYKWSSDEVYCPITVTLYSTGVWDEATERYVFDAQHFVPLQDIDGYSQWYDENNPYGDNYKYFATMEYLPSYRMYDYVMFNNSLFEWDDEEEEYVPFDGEQSKITVTTNSKLRTLRIPRGFVNEYGFEETPGMYEDWLYYYKVGYITGKVIETDDIGNIVSDVDDFIPNQTCYYLHAYGNLIIDITFNASRNAVTFKYVIGAHLLADADHTVVDIDGNKLRYYTNFRYDEESGDGVVFTETYQCSGDAIASLGVYFNDYVNGEDTTVAEHKYDRFPFDTVPVVNVDGSVSIEGTGTATFEAYADLLHTPTVADDWMVGLYQQPKIKSAIDIDRGNGASFERHIKLGEIRSMEDLETYQNGAFFKLSKV